MRKSYIIKYIGKIDNGKTTTELYRMRLQDIIGDLTHGRGLKAGEKIKIWKQSGNIYLYQGYIYIKKDIAKFEQDSDFKFINLPNGIAWRNGWNISRQYYGFKKLIK